MLGILIHSSVGWSFDHIFCCLLCTFIWHKQRNTHTHTRTGEASCTTQHCESLSHTHTSPHLLRHLQMSSTVRTHTILHAERCTRIHTRAHTHTHTNQLLLLYPTNLGDQRLINKSSVMEEVTEQRNADMDSRQYWISLYHHPLVFAAQLW